jgi:hypothetical protein
MSEVSLSHSPTRLHLQQIIEALGAGQSDHPLISNSLAPNPHSN